MNHKYIFLALISATTITHAASSDGGPAKTPEQRLEKIESLAVAQATNLAHAKSVLQQRRASLEKQKEGDLKAAAAQEQQEQVCDAPSTQEIEEDWLKKLSPEMEEGLLCRRMAKYPQNAYKAIKEYRAENRALQSRVKELEEQLAKIQGQAAKN